MSVISDSPLIRSSFDALFSGFTKMATTHRNRSNISSKKRVNFQNLDSDDNEDFKSQYSVWTPTLQTTFKALLSARLCAAIWSNISDCDETYNYWEPSHYLMYGNGFQTWEYSPKYAIRSYAYLWLHILPLKFYQNVLNSNKVQQFYFMRCLLGFCSSLCEVYFYRAVWKQFGANVARITLCFLLFGTGMFISSTAFLPSSFAMYMTFTSMAGWMMGHYPVAILATAASAIIGWPFAGALGIPIAFDIVVRQKKVLYFIKWTVISAAVFLIPLIQIDSHYYGKLVIAPLNIVLYNVFSTHGPDIYGVEPWSYYFVNGFLNFNVAFLLAIVALPYGLAVKYLLKHSGRGLPLWLSLAPMYIWIAIFFTRPHKEERFLFPIYPFFALAAAICLENIQIFINCMTGVKKSRHNSKSSSWISGLTLLVFVLLSVSRTCSLYKGYHAPLDVYVELQKVATDPKIHTMSPNKDVNVCVGKEWYRYPSHFFLPNDRWHLQLIKSEFKGQLPKPYEVGPQATRVIPSHMNDMNLEEPTRYINITRCHYLVDLDTPDETPHEPRYAQDTSQWTTVATAKFLDASRSHKLFRAFYIPFLTEKFCSYVDYNILKTKRTRKKTQTL